MKRKFLRGLLVAGLIFPALFAARLLYGYVQETVADPEIAGLLGNHFGNGSGGGGSGDLFSETRKNYASSKFGRGEKQGSGGVAQVGAAVLVDQKFEKVATLRADTRKFDEDEGRLRGSIHQHNAMIQFEQAHGLKGARELRMSIGVPPVAFDTMLDEVHAIGTTVEFQVDKTDKTNEYKDLAAKRSSQEKARAALVGLKGQGGRIDEQINLENKILEIEEAIQQLGVRLGEFDAENEFVTIHFRLTERAPAAVRSVSLAHRVSVALHWAVLAYAALFGLVLLVSATVLVLVALLQKLNWIPQAMRELA